MDFKRPENWKETNIYFIVPFFSCLIASIGMAILKTQRHNYFSGNTGNYITGVDFKRMILGERK